MAAQSKATLLNDVQNALRKRYKPGPKPERLPVLEAVVYGICHEGVTREQANQALSRFKDQYFDWNEVRVSPIEEIEALLAGLPHPGERAMAIRRFLRKLFEKTYGFNLEGLVKKPLKEAIKALEEFEALRSDYVLATVIQHSLNGHAIPIDAPILRALARLGACEPNIQPAVLRPSVERAVPKNRGAEFGDLLEDLAHDTCIDGIPDCPRCVLLKMCPSGKDFIAGAKAAAVAQAKAAKLAAKGKPAEAKAVVQASPSADKSKSNNSKPLAKPAAGPAKAVAPKAPAAKPVHAKPSPAKSAKPLPKKASPAPKPVPKPAPKSAKPAAKPAKPPAHKGGKTPPKGKSGRGR